jgi:hypothetical protein
MQLTRRTLLAAGAALALAPGAAAADPLADNDLAWLRLLVGTELLGADFYAAALAARKLGSKQLGDALAAEKQHYALLAGLLSAAGAAPATADDLDFSYPRGAFATAGATAKLAVALESTFLGAYLGAVDAVQAPALKLPLARIAAAQAQHRAVFEQLLGAYPLRPPLPGPLPIDRASNLLDPYLA